MSADNGIYILRTKDHQCRVIHTQGIDNLYWSFVVFSDSDDLIPTRLIEFFNKSKYTCDQDLARNIAFNMAKKVFTLEYGVREITIDKTWKQIVKEAKELALLEIESIKNKNNVHGIWNYELSLLQKIINM